MKAKQTSFQQLQEENDKREQVSLLACNNTHLVQELNGEIERLKSHAALFKSELDEKRVTLDTLQAKNL